MPFKRGQFIASFQLVPATFKKAAVGDCFHQLFRLGERRMKRPVLFVGTKCTCRRKMLGGKCINTATSDSLLLDIGHCIAKRKN